MNCWISVDANNLCSAKLQAVRLAGPTVSAELLFIDEAEKPRRFCLNVIAKTARI